MTGLSWIEEAELELEREHDDRLEAAEHAQADADRAGERHRLTAGEAKARLELYPTEARQVRRLPQTGGTTT